MSHGIHIINFCVSPCVLCHAKYYFGRFHGDLDHVQVNFGILYGVLGQRNYELSRVHDEIVSKPRHAWVRKSRDDGNSRSPEPAYRFATRSPSRACQPPTAAYLIFVPMSGNLLPCFAILAIAND